MFAGSLTQISLGEVLRLLSLSSQTGALILETRDFSASIFLQVGQIVHAAIGPVEGLDALTQICDQVEANFVFSEGFMAPGRSLADYPTDKLIEKVKKRVEEIAALRAAILGPYDIPCYLPGRKVSGLVAKPDELALLLLADGKRSVHQIAGVARRDLAEVGEIFGKFRHAGVLEVVGVQETPVTPPEPGPQGQAGSPGEPKGEASLTGLLERGEGKPVRYWRGKRIE
ncbi:MAG: hypothetical protein OHK005_01750 [Candidatus Methylacidiphilales bacterium]